MNAESLIGIWTGTAHNSNDWDMKITISILQPFEVGSTAGSIRYSAHSLHRDISGCQYSR
ncbi:MAG: hypothetical protein QM730_00120 [Anaerolineales bacterium]